MEPVGLNYDRANKNMNAKHRLLTYWTPKGAVDTAIYMRACLQRFKHRTLLANNKSQCNIHQGEIVYVLGNGPSLKNVSLIDLKSSKVITMNHFELHPAKDELDIVAHCIGEPYRVATWEDPAPMINGVKSKSYWFNLDANEYFSKVRTNKNIYYYLPGVSEHAGILSGEDPSGVALQYQSTSQMAIMVAMYMGFQEIRLAGFDHDWLVTRGNSPHFYDDSDEVPPADLSKFSYTQMIRISLRLFEIYERINEIAQKKGVKIYNCSEPSYLDIFPRSPRRSA